MTSAPMDLDKPRVMKIVDLSRAEKVAAYIDTLIGTGQLAPGDIVNEAKIALALGMSRVPVREAVRMLVGEGLLELQPQRSARVRRVEGKRLLEMLEVLTHLSALAIRRLGNTEVRSELWADIDQIAKRISRTSVEDGGYKAMQSISQLHYYLIYASGNNYLLEIVQKSKLKYYLHFLVDLVGRDAVAKQRSVFCEIIEMIKEERTEVAVAMLLKAVEELSASA